MKLVREGREVETSSLANSGYESETPQILIPIKVALRVWIALKAVKVKVVVADTALTPLAMFKLMNLDLAILISISISTRYKLRFILE